MTSSVNLTLHDFLRITSIAVGAIFSIAYIEQTNSSYHGEECKRDGVS